LHEELEIQSTLGRSSWGKGFSTPIEASPTLESSQNEGFWSLGHHGEGELVRGREGTVRE